MLKPCRWFLIVGAVGAAAVYAADRDATGAPPPIASCHAKSPGAKQYFCFSGEREGYTGPTGFSAKFFAIKTGIYGQTLKPVGWINAYYGIEWITPDERVLYQMCEFGGSVLKDASGKVLEELDRGCHEWRILNVKTLGEKTLKLPGADFFIAKPAFRYPLVAYAVSLPRYKFGCKVLNIETNQEIVFLKTTANVPETDVPQSALVTFSEDGKALICMSSGKYFVQELPSSSIRP